MLQLKGKQIDVIREEGKQQADENAIDGWRTWNPQAAQR
jgi:hypothetical protein